MASAQDIRNAASEIGAAYHIKGDLSLDGMMVHGWCWSPSRAHARLRVALVMDDVEIAAAVAARLRLDLVRDGVCDGYHGYSFQLPPRSFSRLEAREVATGQVFGRLFGTAMADTQVWTAQSETLARQLDDANTAISRQRNEWRGASLAPTLAQVLGRHRPERSLVRGLSLPVITNPGFSLILDAGCAAEDCLASVMRLGPLLGVYGAELLVVDTGRSARSADLSSLPGLSYLLTPSSNAADRLNCAIARARGARILLIRSDIFEGMSASAVARWLRGTPDAREVVVGTTMGRGLHSVTEAKALGDNVHGVLISAAHEVFAAVGPLDPTLDDGAHLPELDFAIRAQRAGYRLVAADDDTTLIADEPVGGTADARLRFRQKIDGRIEC